MNWDNKAYEHAEARSSEYFGHLPEQMFEEGAKWQRDQLRTDEAIERVARSLSARRQCGDCDRGYSPETCGECWGDAAAAIAALIGEDE